MKHSSIACGFVALATGCASVPTHTLAVHKFEFSQTAYSNDEWGGTDYGKQIRDQLESRLAQKPGLSVVARSPEAEKQAASEVSRNRIKQMEQSIAADKVVTGSCKRFVEIKTASVWKWWEYPIFFIAWTWNSMEEGKKYTSENLQCSYNVLDVGSQRIELSDTLSTQYEGVRGLGNALDSFTVRIADEVYRHFK